MTHLRLVLFLIGLLLAAGGSAAHAESGTASVYGSNGGETASGERGNSSALTAAHRTLPFGTMVQVTNKNNGLSITVRINDRGPFTLGRVIDLTTGGAGQLGMSDLAPVDLTVLSVPLKSTLPRWLSN